MIWMLHLFFDNLFFWSILNENVIVNSEAENVNTKIEAETFELLWMFFSLPFTEALYGILTWSCEHFWLTHNWIFQWFYYLEKKNHLLYAIQLLRGEYWTFFWKFWSSFHPKFQVQLESFYLFSIEIQLFFLFLIHLLQVFGQFLYSKISVQQ